MTNLSFNQIRAQVAAVRKKLPESTAIAIRSNFRWSGESQRSDGDETYFIHQCDSPLAMRVALRDQGGETNGDARRMSILITDLDDEQIGDDILVRLKPRKVVPLDNWQIVKSLFQAREIDPRVTKHHWIATELMDYGAIRDCPPAASGFLDAETVWQILLRRLIGFEGETPDLLGILKWSTSIENVRRLRKLDTPVRDAVRDWMVGLAGPAAACVLKAASTHEKPDALPIGLAAGVVLHAEAKGKLEKASGKLEERYLSGETPSASNIAAWHAAACDVVRLGLSDGRLKQQLLGRGDEILHEVGGDAFAWLSDTSAIGFDQRLARFGEELGLALEAMSKGPVSLDSLVQSRDRLLAHDRAARERRRMDRVQMAMRLVRWLSSHAPEKGSDTVSRNGPEGASQKRYLTPFPPPASLSDAADIHLRDGSFVDWARLTLRSGDPVRDLSNAYAKLFDRVTDIAESRSRTFAEKLKDWTAAHSDDESLIPVEHILGRIVAPIAEKNPVLVILIDGMSVAVLRELMDDVLGSDWALLAEDDRGLRCGLATVPSVTEVSRTSLMCGKLVRGASANEKVGFAEHPALVSASRVTHPPILFHKASLQESEDASLAADIRKEIGSSHRKVVGVVVNAVDDHLLKGEQIDTRWTRDEIKVLPSLLHEAKMSRRTVILLSDHGHVLDCNATGKKADGGERWRVDTNDAGEQELQVSGSRVVIPGENQSAGKTSLPGEALSLIAPWSEKLRYGIKKNGYHGGLTPQEMVVPIAVLSTSDLFPAGWQEASVDLPLWWNEPPVVDAGPGFDGDWGREGPVIKPQPKKTPETLFDFVEPETSSEPDSSSGSVGKEAPAVLPWVDALLASPVFEQQKMLGGRSTPTDEMFAKVLSTIDVRGGKMTSPALAAAIGLSPMRLRGLLAIAGRVLNIDGYAVLTRDEASDTVTLDRTLLCRQFDLT
jgi:hypothetical protein